MSKNTVLWVLVGVGVGLLLCIGWKHVGHRAAHMGQQVPAGMGHYESEHVGVSFTYPDKYDLVSRHAGEGHIITLTPKDYTPPQDGDGPAAITVQEFVNAEGLPLETFIRNEPMANFGLGDGTTKALEIGGQPALSYAYSGLYENDAFAVAAHGKVYVLATGWTSATDPLRQELKDLLTTVKFIDHAR